MEEYLIIIQTGRDAVSYFFYYLTIISCYIISGREVFMPSYRLFPQTEIMDVTLSRLRIRCHE
jgi:hypothetical protein